MNVAENLRFDLDIETGSAVAAINTFFSAFDKGAAEAKTALRNTFDQSLETEVQLTLKNGKVVAKQIEKIGTDTDRISTAVKAMNGNFGKTPAEVKRSLNALKTLRSNTEKIDKETGKISRSWKLVSDKINEATRAKRAFSNVPIQGGGPSGGEALGQAFTMAGIKARLASDAIMAAGQAIQGAISGMVERSRELSKLNTALNSFTSGQEQTNAIMELAKTTGLAYGVSIQSVENAWKRVAPAATAAGLSLGETNSVITAATARITQMGLSSEQAGRYMEALAQVMGKGKLQGEELRQQFAELDGALQTQLATYLQATHGIVSLDDAMSKGQVSSRMFADALVAISDGAVRGMITNLGNLNDQFGQLNLEQKINNLNNVLTIAKEEWGDIFGPFGDSILRASTLLSGYIATFSTRFPALSGIIQAAMTRIGEILEMTVYGLIILFDQVAKSLEWLATSSHPVAKALRAIAAPLDSLMKVMGKEGDLAEGWDSSVQGARDLVGEMGAMDQLIEKTLAEQQALVGGQEAGTAEARSASAALRDQKSSMTELSALQKDATAGAKEAKKSYEGQRREVDSMAASIKARYDNEIASVQAAANKTRTRIQEEKQAYGEMKEAVKARYDEERSLVEDIYSRKLSALDAEADRLRGKTPAEEKLYELEKEALERKIESGNLEGEALLRAQARLERMERQEELEKLAIQRKEVEKNKAAELKRLEADRDKKLKEMEKTHKASLRTLEDQLKSEKDKVKSLQDAKKEIDLIKKGTEAYNGDLAQGVTNLKNQVGKMEDIEKKWSELQRKADTYAKTIQSALRDSASLEVPTAGGSGSGSGLDGALATGGPVVGGGKYQVNELGKEAFLSAAGRLSMIDAPSFGTWQAPTSGTVIPAHLTRQLDIPTGGININKTAGMSAGRSMGRAGRITQAAGGDTFHQNVTVQAANPVQAANNLMVEMTRLKRRRFG